MRFHSSSPYVSLPRSFLIPFTLGLGSGAGLRSGVMTGLGLGLGLGFGFGFELGSGLELGLGFRLFAPFSQLNSHYYTCHA